MKVSVMLFAVSVAGALALPALASAADGETLAKSNGCMACHSVNAKLVGPSYKDVAVKYAGDATGEAHLIAKIRDGGSGVWGPVPMPPHPNISEADLKTLADWVLAQK